MAGEAVPLDDLPNSLRGHAVPADDLPGAKDVAAQDHPHPALEKALSYLTRAIENGSGVSLGDAALSVGSGALGKTASDIAGLGAIPLHALGLIDKDPEQVQQATRNALAYQPRTAGGADLVNGIGAVADHTVGALSRGAGNLAASGAGALGADQGTQDVVRSGATEIANQIPAIAAPFLKGAAVAGEGAEAANAARTGINPTLLQTMQDSHNAGIVLTPEYAANNTGIASKLASTAGSETKLQQAASKANGTVAGPRIVKSDLGIPADQPLTPQVLQDQQASANAVYKQVRKAGTFQVDPQLVEDMGKVGGTDLQTTANGGKRVSQDIEDLKKQFTPQQRTNPMLSQSYPQMNSGAIVDDINTLRQKARENFDSTTASDKPLARAQLDTSNALESFLERSLKNTNNPLSGALSAARQKLAKLGSLTGDGGAYNSATGSIDAAKLARDLDNGVPLSGGLLTIAKSYKAFPKVWQKVERLPTSDGPTFGDIGAGVVGAMTHSPLLAAAGVARPFARSLVLKPGYQSQLVAGNTPGILGKLQSVTPAQVNNPFRALSAGNPDTGTLDDQDQQ